MPVACPIPRINTNEDQLLVAELHVKVGDRVREGDLLAVVESTKAANEVHAPVAGVIAALPVTLKAMADVGAPLALIEPEGGSAQATATEESTGEVHISAKARQRARELGIDLAEVTAKGDRIRVEDIEEAAASRPLPAPEAIPPGTPCVIIGGGGHAACLIDALAAAPFTILGCTDSALPAGTRVCRDVRVLGGDEVLARLRDEGVRHAFIGIGGTTGNRARRKVYDKAVALGFTVPPLVAASAVIGFDTAIGPGAQVLAKAVVGPRCTIGANTIVNVGSLVCHDSKVGDDVHLTPGSVVAGNVRVGSGTTLGMGATVLFGTRIGRGCLIHNGANVVGDLIDDYELTRTGERRRRK